MDIPDITRYDTKPDVVECVVPAPHGHLVYFTDYELVVQTLQYRVRELEAELEQARKL